MTHPKRQQDEFRSLSLTWRESRLVLINSSDTGQVTEQRPGALFDKKES